MSSFVLITGNQQKADYLAKWLDTPVEHRKVDLDEIQSLDLRTVVEHKARQAHAIVGSPVLVEDVALTFTAMGRLPGTFVKWFLEEVGQEGLCRIADSLEHRQAEAAIMYALYDGEEMQICKAIQKGTISMHPRGTNGFGWNHIFQPEHSDLTYGEMDEATFKHWNIRAHAITQLKKIL